MNLRLTITSAVATLLASVALYPLMSGWRWFWAGAAVVVVVAAIGATARMRMLPAAVSFLAALGGEFLLLNLMFASKHSWAGLLPTNASLHDLGRLVSGAMDQMSRFAPPVPTTQGIMLLTAAGTGLVAAGTDLLAVRLRKPALAGLPLLVLFCVPLTTDVKPSWPGATLAFCLGIAGYLALLSADGRDRLRLWGRLVHRWQGEPEGRTPDTRPLSAAGRRIGFTAVAIAICLPLLVPGLKQHRLFAGSGGTGGHGFHGSIQLPDPLLQLNAQLRDQHPLVVLHYRTTDPQPPYLQVYVLGELTTHTWSLAPLGTTDPVVNGRLLPTPTGLSRGTGGNTVHETITLGDTVGSSTHNESYLPLPYAPRSVTVPGSWRVDRGDLTVIAPGAKLSGLRYTVTSDDVTPSAAQLRDTALPANMDGYLTVPDAFKSLTKLAEKITKGRTTAFGKAVALQQWFTKPGNFTYSLRPAPPKGSKDLDTFLTKSKTGYCQQFAFAMAVLARLLHIPSRVAVGYTQGSYTDAETWVVRTSDAHAWPELFFPGAGWLRFEPTPSGSPGQATASAPQYTVSATGGNILPPQFGPPSSTGPGGRPTATPSPGGQLGRLLPHNETGGGGSAPSGGSPPVAGLVLALLAVALVAPRTVRSARRRWRWWRATDDADRAHTAWLELRDDLADYRIMSRPSESPRRLAARLVRTLGLAGAEAEALGRVAQAEERASYAVSPAGSGSLRKDMTVVRRAMARACGPRIRWSARLLPSSALATMRAALAQALDVFGWIDMLVNRARSRSARAPQETVMPSWQPGPEKA